MMKMKMMMMMIMNPPVVLEVVQVMMIVMIIWHIYLREHLVKFVYTVMKNCYVSVIPKV
jgi:hypothetical protein